MPPLARHGILAGVLAMAPGVRNLLLHDEPTERAVVFALVGVLLIVASASAGVLLADDGRGEGQ